MKPQQMALHLGDATAAVLKQRAFSAKPRGGPAGLRRSLLLYVLPRMPRGIKTGADPAAAAVDPADVPMIRSASVTSSGISPSRVGCRRSTPMPPWTF